METPLRAIPLCGCVVSHHFDSPGNSSRGAAHIPKITHYLEEINQLKQRVTVQLSLHKIPSDHCHNDSGIQIEAKDRVPRILTTEATKMATKGLFGCRNWP